MSPKDIENYNKIRRNLEKLKQLVEEAELWVQKVPKLDDGGASGGGGGGPRGSGAGQRVGEREGWGGSGLLFISVKFSSLIFLIQD